MEIKYEYPDKEERGLWLRSPALFSYGVAQYKNNSYDYYMSLKSFYDKKNPTKKEVEFRKTIDSISKFLREEWEKENRRKKNKDNSSEDLEIIKDDIFFPRLKVRKIYYKGELNECVIKTIFYGKGEKKEELVDLDPLDFKEIKCKVVAYIDIDDIFCSSSTLKVRTSISDVIIVKKDVPPPPKCEKSPTLKSKVKLGSDDEI